VWDIVNKLYPPEGSYRFDVIGVELLGSNYERYLGKTIRVTARVLWWKTSREDAQGCGVYYTPKIRCGLHSRAMVAS